MNNRFYKFNEHVFDILDNPDKWYWLYYLYCDGSIINNHVVSLACVDPNQLVKWKYFLEADYSIYTYPGIHMLNVRSSYFTGVLCSYGVVPRKTYNHTVPLVWPYNNTAFQIAALRGALDADGWITFRKQATSYSVLKGKRYGPYFNNLVNVGVSNLNIDLLKKYRSFFSTGAIRKYPGYVSTWQYTSTVKKVLPLLDTLYEQGGPVLGKKYSRFQEIKKGESACRS